MTTFEAPHIEKIELAEKAGKATAAASGASATERFHLDKSPFDAVRDVPAERVDLLAREVLDAVHATIRRHKVTYEEYNALKAWLINVGEDGEWPLFLDVWVEHVVEEVATAHRHGNKGSIEGPYYVPDSPELGADATMPVRPGEAGTPLVWEGTITSTDGRPLAGKVELWHADSEGFYSQFAPGIPEWNLRAPSPPVTTVPSASPRCGPRRTRSPPTARAESSSPRPAGTPGVPHICTSRCPPPDTNCSPRSCTSLAIRTTATTSPRPSSLS